MEDEWTNHPGGLRSRPLPDSLPVIDQDQGFQPPFSIDIHELPTRDCFTAEVHKRLIDAARAAAHACKRTRYIRSLFVEITDGQNRRL